MGPAYRKPVTGWTTGWSTGWSGGPLDCAAAEHVVGGVEDRGLARRDGADRVLEAHGCGVIAAHFDGAGGRRGAVAQLHGGAVCVLERLGEPVALVDLEGADEQVVLCAQRDGRGLRVQIDDVAAPAAAGVRGRAAGRS